MPTARPPTPPRRRLLTLAALPWLAAGCALSPFGDPPRVALVGLDSLPGEGLELRFAARIRVQNPNATELGFEGVSLELDLRGQSFASGVAPLAGRVPAYGETVLTVPLTVSAFALARQLVSLARQGDRERAKVSYALRGKLGGLVSGARFDSRGEIDLGA